MARLLGYRLPPNFRAPMLACSLREFWQRWHITLSRWLRDYLYIPLGGNRVSPGRSATNVLITMGLGGLWHGAGWGFIIWGLMHGAGLVAERLGGVRLTIRKIPGGFSIIRTPPMTPQATPAQTSFTALGWFLTQLWILITWIFFRCPDAATAWDFTWKMASISGHHWFMVHRALSIALLPALVILAHHAAPALLHTVPRRRLGLILGSVTGLALFLDLIVVSPVKTFIYFRF